MNNLGSLDYVVPPKPQQQTAGPPPLFVVGPPRCGTTLTAKILGRHSRIFMPGETHFFDDVYSRRRTLGDLQSKESMDRVLARLKTLYARYNEQPDQRRIDDLLKDPAVLDKLTSCRSYVQIFSWFMEFQMRRAGKMRWGNNVPKDLFQVKDILSFYPAAKILVCVRDIRDFLLSYKNKWKTASEEHASRLKSLYHPILMSFLWNASIKQIGRIKALVAGDNLMIVRYENLVESPRQVVSDICRFLGEEFEEDMLQVDAQNSSFHVGETGIYASSVDRWQRMLANEEIYIAQQLSKQRLKTLGYQCENVKANTMKMAYLWVTLPYGLIRALRANSVNRGPMLQYLATRVTALVK